MPENETNLTKISSSDLHSVGVILSTYPSVIFDVDISSFVNKGFHCVLMAFTSCSMQGSSLREKEFSSSDNMFQKPTGPLHTVL